MLNKIKFDNVKTDLELITGTHTGISSTLDLSADYTFLMPFFNLVYSKDLGEDWQMIPSLLIAASVGDKGQQARWFGSQDRNGNAFDVSGNTDQSGNQDANFDLFIIAPGFTILYHPWGISTNIGATIIEQALPGLGEDGVEKVLVLSLSYKWPQY